MGQARAASVAGALGGATHAGQRADFDVSEPTAPTTARITAALVFHLLLGAAVVATLAVPAWRHGALSTAAVLWTVAATYQASEGRRCAVRLRRAKTGLTGTA